MLEPRKGAVMVVHRDEPLQRVTMSWQQYLKLPERPRAEWVGGVAIILNAPPMFDHGRAMVRLGAVLDAGLPGRYVVAESYLKMSEDLVRLPDVMVTDTVPPDGWVIEPPLLVAEVLSPSTEEQDRIDKAAEYAAFGIGHYWLLDPRDQTLEVMRNIEGAWFSVATLDEDNPELTVVVGDTAVSVDVREVLRN